jgi:hypothetical protein
MKSLLIASVIIGNFFISFTSQAQLSDALMLTVSSGCYSDQTAIRFLDVATDRFDSEWDAYKLRNLGNTPNFCSNVEGQTYSINALHGSGLAINKKVSLKLEVAFSETYTITAEQIGMFDSLCTITLFDKLLRTEQDLKTNATYSFNFHIGDPSDRFVIYFKANKPHHHHEEAVVLASDVDVQNQDNQNIQENKGVKIFNNQGVITVQYDAAESSPEISISDMSGNTVVHSTLKNTAATNNSWTFSPNKSDLFIVNFVLNGERYSEKVYLQK